MKSFAYLLLFFSVSAMAAPKAEPWEYWLQHNQNSQQSISHAEWDSWLKKYLEKADNGIHYLNYSEVNPEDKKALSAYLYSLEETTISEYSRPEQQAFWINLYNALTVELILKHYPVETIRDIDISPGFFSNGPWQKKLISIEGQSLSLDDIEHRILRPIWQDPRIHYAVNCASIGCPNLQPKAYTVSNTDALLSLGAKQYINHPRGVSVKNGDLRVSSIYKWFKEDFGNNDKMLIRHFKQYAEEPLKAQLQTFKRIDSYQYDWDLNER